MKKIIALLFLSTFASAAQVCTTLDGSAYSQDQINLAEGLAYSIGYDLDNATLPPVVSVSRSKQVKICFEDPSFNVVTAITTQTLVSRYNADNVVRQANANRIAAWQTELSTTTAAANGIFGNWTNLNAAQKDTILKSIVRIQELKNLLGM